MPAIYTESDAKLAAETIHGAFDQLAVAYQRLDRECAALYRQNRRVQILSNTGWILALVNAVVAALIAGRIL